MTTVARLLKLGDLQLVEELNGCIEEAIASIVGRPWLEAVSEGLPADSGVVGTRIRARLEYDSGDPWTIAVLTEGNYSGGTALAYVQDVTSAIVRWLDQNPEDGLMPSDFVELVPSLRPGAREKINLAKSLRALSPAMMWRAVDLLEAASPQRNPVSLVAITDLFSTKEETWIHQPDGLEANAQDAVQDLLEEAVRVEALRQIRGGQRPAYSTGVQGQSANAPTRVLIELDEQRERAFESSIPMHSSGKRPVRCCGRAGGHGASKLSEDASKFDDPGIRQRDLRDRLRISPTRLSEAVAELRKNKWISGDADGGLRLVRPLSRLLLEGLVSALPDRTTRVQRGATMPEFVARLRHVPTEGAFVDKPILPNRRLFDGFQGPHLQTMVEQCRVRWFLSFETTMNRGPRGTPIGGVTKKEVEVYADAFLELGRCPWCGEPFNDSIISWEMKIPRRHESWMGSPMPHHNQCAPVLFARDWRYQRFAHCGICGGHLWVRTPVMARDVASRIRELGDLNGETDSVGLVVERAHLFESASPGIRKQLERIMVLDLMRPRDQQLFHRRIRALRETIWPGGGTTRITSRPPDATLQEAFDQWVGVAHEIARGALDSGEPASLRWKQGGLVHTWCASLRTSSALATQQADD